ncbi:dehydrodolichyl diphosphate synthase-like [Tropilaelaps mercedesae]|uniref:Alkyl transferase n=1 Tax=Tropilaelaps mercedesae TaxID=418985 RepID=A0A1V9XD84_9ACAR|nr:dehydrodolichyl diphosphate synthase-like [Tropilaelaps mercedesae]
MITTDAPLRMETHNEMDELLKNVPDVSNVGNIILKILSNGIVPNHVAVILDGNRRFARERGLPSHQGHKEGAKAMAQAGYLLRRLGTKELTMYILSVHNLKNRTPEELNNLFNAFRHAADYVYERHLEEMIDSKIFVRVIGDLSLLPPDIAARAAKLELLTRRDDGDYMLKLNFAVGYGSRHNLARITGILKQAVDKGIIEAKDIDHDVVTVALDAEECPVIDLLLRTSGERRLSDFMLWQTTFSLYHFCTKNLPNFGFWSFVYMILNYQIERPIIQSYATKAALKPVEKGKLLSAVHKFVDELRTDTLLKFSGMKREEILQLKLSSRIL